jgi:hypothetical protein
MHVRSHNATQACLLMLPCPGRIYVVLNVIDVMTATLLKFWSSNGNCSQLFACIMIA